MAAALVFHLLLSLDTALAQNDTTTVTRGNEAADSLATSDVKEPIDVEADRLIGSRGPEGEVILLQGNVVLRQGTSTVRSERGRYVTAARTVYLSGNVVANDGTLQITSDQADFFQETELILLSGNVHVTDEGFDATSEFGSYNAITRRAELWGEVHAVDHGQHIKARQVFYNRDTQIAEAHGDVWAADSTGTDILEAESVLYDRTTEMIHALGSPRIRRLEGDQETILLADTLRLDNKTGLAWADGNVHLDRDTLAAKGGHGMFWTRDHRGMIFGDPRVWNDEMVASGDTIEVFTNEDGDIERADIRGAAEIEYVGRFGIGAGEKNIIKSPHVVAFFGGQQVDSLYAVSGAENIYEGAPKRDRIPERNEIKGDIIKVHFKNSGVNRAVVTGSPVGQYRFELAGNDSSSMSKEVVHYSGDRVEFEVKDRDIRIDGNASVAYQGMDLKAGRVVFDSREGNLIARDDPILNNPSDEELKGRTMTYDLESRTGTIYQGNTEFERGFYAGSAIHDAGNNTLLVKGASYTTCDAEHPHYHVGANTMKVQLKDRIIARPIVLFLKKIPIFALPFYIIPVNDERHSGIIFPQIQLGFSSSTGRFIRNLGYFWAVNDYLDFTAAGDYYSSDNLWVGRFDTRYNVLGKLQGFLNTRFTGGGDAFDLDQYEVQGSHNQTLNDRTRVTAQANFTSSRDFTRDIVTGQPLENRFNRFLVSTANLTHRRDWGAFNFYYSRRQDLDTNPVSSPNLPELEEDLPRVDFSLPQRAVGRKTTDQEPGFLPFFSSTYFNFSFRAANHSERFRITEDSTFTDHFRAMRGIINISDNRRIPGGVTISPRFSSTAVLYDEDALKQEWQPAAVYNLGLGASGTYYGTFKPRLLGLTGIRHIFFPQVSFNFQPEFSSLSFVDTNGVRRIRFPSKAGISIAGSEQRNLTYSLQNRFQIKFRRGDEDVQFPNFLTWNVNGAYDFQWREKGFNTGWRPMINRIRIQPPGYFSLDAATQHSFDYKPYLRSYNFNAGLNLSGGSGRPSLNPNIPMAGNEAMSRPQGLASAPWTASFTYAFAAGRLPLGNWDTNQTANMILSVNPTANWHLDYYNTLNITDGEIVAQEFAVVRNLHCWQARFVRRFVADGESEFYFRISIRDRPDLYIEQGTRGLGTPVNF